MCPDDILRQNICNLTNAQGKSITSSNEYEKKRRMI